MKKKYYVLLPLICVFFLTGCSSYEIFIEHDNTPYRIAFIIAYLVVACVFGFITKNINENKGYSGGFLWGFFLGVIGIIVVAVRSDNFSHNQYSMPKHLDEDYQRKKTLDNGGWVCKKCGRVNAVHVGTCGCGMTKADNSGNNDIEIGNIEKIQKYKELLDSGVLTQEEFDAKKKQILNL